VISLPRWTRGAARKDGAGGVARAREGGRGSLAIGALDRVRPGARCWSV